MKHTATNHGGKPAVYAGGKMITGFKTHGDAMRYASERNTPEHNAENRLQVFGRGTRRVVVQPGVLVTIGGHVVASWEAGRWVPRPWRNNAPHLPTLSKALATVFDGFTWQDLQTAGSAFALSAVWADCDDGTRPRVTDQLQATGMHLAVWLAQVEPAAVAAAIDRRGLSDFGHDLFLTARGHGAGFWDRQELREGDVGDTLSGVLRRVHLETEQYRGYMTAYVGGLA